MSSSTRKPNKNCSKKEEMSLYKRQRRRINYGAKSPHGCDAMEIEVEENFGWIGDAILKNSTMKISDTRSYRWMDLGRETKKPAGW